MPAHKKRKLSHDGSSSETDLDVEQAPNPALASQENDGLQATENEASAQSFHDLGLIDQLCEACEQLSYKKPTPIQAQSIPLALQGRDIIGLAETGSGKTAAFVLPILQALMEKQQTLHSLILVPTRELAYQIAQAVDALGAFIGVRKAVLVGGMDMIPQSIALGKKPHVIVATPGRLLDHLENTKGFSLRQLKFLVMDEADRLLDLDFGPILEKILKNIPKEGRHTYLFSATMSSKVESLQRASLSNPVRVSVSRDKYQTVEKLQQSFYLIPHKHKDIWLVYVLNRFAGQTGIIFTRTVNEAQRLSILLKSLGFSAVPIHGQLSQSSRLEALNKFRAKSKTLLVATDVAARGLDIPSMDLVINYDLPDSSKTYVHRVGRTARAGKSGVAMSLVTQYDAELWLRIEHALGKKVADHDYDAEKAEAMVFADSVGEAQKVATMEMKDLHENRGKKGAVLRNTRNGGAKHVVKRRRDNMDQDDG